jgi:hypothetical protein
MDLFQYSEPVSRDYRIKSPTPFLCRLIQYTFWADTKRYEWTVRLPLSIHLPGSSPVASPPMLPILRFTSVLLRLISAASRTTGVPWTATTSKRRRDSSLSSLRILVSSLRPLSELHLLILGRMDDGNVLIRDELSEVCLLLGSHRLPLNPEELETINVVKGMATNLSILWMAITSEAATFECSSSHATKWVR